MDVSSWTAGSERPERNPVRRVRTLPVRVARRSAIFAALFAAALAATAQGAAGAETSGSGLGGFASDPDAPIEIEADALDVEDQKHMATFIGNVVATQGDLKLRADRLKADYASKSGTKTRITEILATGNVHITSEDDQSADGDWARYTVATRIILMGDKVVLRQGENVIRGSKLSIDLNSGKSRIVGGAEAGTPKNAANGRVKALFQPPPKDEK